MQDLWLLKLTGSIEACEERLAPLRRGGAPLQAWHALSGELSYVYLAGELPAIEAAAPGTQWRRLIGRLDLPGASARQAPAFHYVVETDVLPAHETDFIAWYDTEHLPGLAAVPGTVRAAHFVCTAGSPRYHACYDLVTPETLGCEPWLAVRNSAWSSRVRPTFRNTQRTMFRRA